MRKQGIRVIQNCFYHARTSDKGQFSSKCTTGFARSFYRNFNYYCNHQQLIPRGIIIVRSGQFPTTAQLLPQGQISVRRFSVSRPTSSSSSSVITTLKDELKSKENVDSFLQALTEDQRKLIYQSLHVEVLKEKYMNELASESHYLSKFGRPTASAARWGTEDPTGTLTEVSQKWLKDRAAETTTEDSIAEEKTNSKSVHTSDLFAVGLKNALPFIGFGFLDNLIMILAGDYIDLTIGAALGISTMAAAALGNTISDVAGIGSAWYVESFAERIGIRDPVLTAAQQTSGAVRWCSNLGRALGVVIGCLLGMLPLAFLHNATTEDEGGAHNKSKRHGAAAAEETKSSSSSSSSKSSQEPSK